MFVEISRTRHDSASGYEEEITALRQGDVFRVAGVQSAYEAIGQDTFRLIIRIVDQAAVVVEDVLTRVDGRRSDLTRFDVAVDDFEKIIIVHVSDGYVRVRHGLVFGKAKGGVEVGGLLGGSANGDGELDGLGLISAGFRWRRGGFVDAPISFECAIDAFGAAGGSRVAIAVGNLDDGCIT